MQLSRSPIRPPPRCSLLSTGKIFGQISSAKFQFCKTRANLSQEPVLVSHWTLLPPLGPLEWKLGLGRDTRGLQHPLAKVYKPERIHFSLSQLVLLSNLNIWPPVKMSILFWDPCDTFVFSKYPQNLALTWGMCRGFGDLIPSSWVSAALSPAFSGQTLSVGFPIQELVFMCEFEEKEWKSLTSVKYIFIRIIAA